MLTKTSETAFKALLYVGLNGGKEPLSPRVIAEAIGESSSYMAKIIGMLVKANILRAHRGVLGGVTLGRSPADITALKIVETCQGAILGDYCQQTDQLQFVCGFHKIMQELHLSVISVLSKWTLQDLLDRPVVSGKLAGRVNCRMAEVQAACMAAGRCPSGRT